jgi:hypothetical protein
MKYSLRGFLMALSKEERNEIIEQLKEQYPILEQVKFNEFNINDKLQSNTELKFYYQELYEQEKFIYEKLLEKLDIIKAQRFDFYKFEYDRVLTKTEIEQYYFPADKKIRKMNDIIKKQEIRVNFFSLCVKSIDKLYWNIKTYLDNEKL